MANIWFDKIRASLINKGFERSELKEKVTPKTLPVYPCITVSRETGSGGRLIAQLVAKKLKMKYYDKEFVELIAKTAKKSRQLVEVLDERNRDIIEGIIDSLKANKNKFNESNYFSCLCRVVLSLIHKQPAVFLGRGANFIVPKDKSLNVRIVAPLKTRISAAMKYEKKSLAKAKADIRKTHFARKEFVKRYFLKNISDANYYDLVINTQYISLEQAVDIVVKAFKERFVNG